MANNPFVSNESLMLFELALRNLFLLDFVGFMNCRQESDSVEIVHGRL